jgi:catechol 2,3-dioxygenase-like lactoylglutathione lyase family enzyme
VKSAKALLNRRILDPMLTLSQITLLVRDYDEALGFYVGKLGFELLEDSPQDTGKRRVVVAPPGSSASLVLAKATTPEQQARIGDQSGGRVFLYLHTDDIGRDFRMLTENGVTILRAPTEADFGTALVFEDLYGNKWDLVQPA